MQLISVYSGHISEVGYDAAEQRLIVKYRNGQSGFYEGVPPDVWDKVTPSNNPSVGGAIHAHIRGRFNFTYIDKDKDTIDG